MKQKPTDKVWFGYDISVAPGPVLRPTEIRLWQEKDFVGRKPESPFYYKSDALVGLSLAHLKNFDDAPSAPSTMNYQFCHDAWQSLEPHFELFHRSAGRVQAIRSKLPAPNSTKFAEATKKIEASIKETISSAQKNNRLDLEALCEIIDHIEVFEKETGSNLLYNFQVKFSKETLHSLHYLFSLLFNLRTLIALDHNAHVLDSSHECLKVDSINDYLPRPEYISNDAIMYKSLKDQKSVMPEKAYLALINQHRTYAHNGVALIENLPVSFINSWKESELVEALHIVQMDWLLGTESGLLYRIREDLYGLREGYEQIFWPDWVERKSGSQSTLRLSCELRRSDFSHHDKVA